MHESADPARSGGLMADDSTHRASAIPEPDNIGLRRPEGIAMRRGCLHRHRRASNSAEAGATVELPRE
jgi:hypothetical protein